MHGRVVAVQPCTTLVYQAVSGRCSTCFERRCSRSISNARLFVYLLGLCPIVEGTPVVRRPEGQAAGDFTSCGWHGGIHADCPRRDKSWLDGRRGEASAGGSGPLQGLGLAQIHLAGRCGTADACIRPYPSRNPVLVRPWTCCLFLLPPGGVDGTLRQQPGL